MFINGRIYKEYDENYYISAYGDIYSVRKERDITHQVDNKGNHKVKLYGYHYSVARLVYDTWNGEIIDGLMVLHKDGDRDNNHYSNLYLGTRADSQRAYAKLGRFPGTPKILRARELNTGKEYVCRGIKDFYEQTGVQSNHRDIWRLTNSSQFKDRFELISFERE